MSSPEEEELDKLPFSEMVLRLADKVCIFCHLLSCSHTAPHSQATALVKERLVAEDQSKASDREKEAKVQGILNQIVATNATLHVAFPIHRQVSDLHVLYSKR